MKKFLWKAWWMSPSCYRSFLCKWLKSRVRNHVNAKNSLPTSSLKQVCYCIVHFWSVRNTTIFSVLVEINFLIFHSLLHLLLDLFLLWWKRVVNYDQFSPARLIRTLITNENLLHLHVKLPHRIGAYKFFLNAKVSTANPKLELRIHSCNFGFLVTFVKVWIQLWLLDPLS